MVWLTKTCKLEEASSRTGIDKQLLVTWIENDWICPCEPCTLELDEEDMARAQLIKNLREDLGVNDEGISITLHLLDQLHYLRRRLSDA